MSLGDHGVSAVFATADIEKAKEFYGGKLGLEVEADHTPDGPVTYRAGHGTFINVYESPEHAGKSTATMAGWGVDDVEAVVDELTAAGVEFERYDESTGPGATDEKGIIEFEGGKVAFFRDPDGNTHSVNQG